MLHHQEERIAGSEEEVCKGDRQPPGEAEPWIAPPPPEVPSVEGIDPPPATAPSPPGRCAAEVSPENGMLPPPEVEEVGVVGPAGKERLNQNFRGEDDRGCVDKTGACPFVDEEAAVGASPFI